MSISGSMCVEDGSARGRRPLCFAARDRVVWRCNMTPTAEVRRFTQSLREPAATVAPYYRVGLAVRSCVVNFRTRSTPALFEYFQRPVGVHGHYQLAADHLEHGQVGIDHERCAMQRHHRNPPPDPELTCDHLIAVR